MSALPDTLITPEFQAGVGSQAFPTWPPPSGGAPVTAWEMGPILNPYPYGSPQPANISSSPPAPAHPWGATFFPKKIAATSGQNQPGGTLPAWPHSRVCVLPDKASPSLSAISPAPRFGPGPQSLSWEVGPIAGNPAPGTTFPAGHYIDGLGTVITPTRIVGGLGN
jgi:hypothetical protein